jgi:hypothetical protein
MMTRISDGETRCLAISVGAAEGRGSALTKILGLKSSPGWLVDAADAHEWRFIGTMERSGQIFLYGPDESGRSLESVLSLSISQALPYLSRLAEALSVLEQRGTPLFPLQTDAVLFSDAGSVLFLPPRVIREIRGLSPFSISRDSYEAINHPDLEGQQRASFALASMLYRIIAGRYPFGGSTAEEIHEQARKLEILAPDRIVPELASEVSSAVMRGLCRPRNAAGLSLVEWTAKLKVWQSMDLMHEVQADEKEKLSRESISRQEEKNRNFRRRIFWEKNWKIAVVIAACAIGAGVVVGSYLTRAFAPRPTKGFSSSKIVETFYLSMNRMDSALMEACVVNKAGQGEINEATNLFVISRVTIAYEGKSNIAAADEWDAHGRPAIDPPQSVFGVTNLSIEKERPEPEPMFIAVYEKWSPIPAEGEGSSQPSTDRSPRFEGRRIKDRVFLKIDKGDWVIYRIDRLEIGQLGAAW